MRRQKGGYAMVMVLCVMAIITVLAMALLLAVSVVLRSEQNKLQQEQCRILAESVSRTIEQQITEDGAEDSSLAVMLKDGIISGQWPYYDETLMGHTAQNAWRTFTFQQDSVPENVRRYVKTDEISAQMYWETETDGDYNSIILTVRVSCTAGKQICTVTSSYTLNTENAPENTDEAGAQPSAGINEQWRWSLNWRQ